MTRQPDAGEDHHALLARALRADAAGQRHLLAGDRTGASAELRRAAQAYRRAFEIGPTRGFGRLVGMLKAAILAGDGEAEAATALELIDGDGDSPASCYAVTIACLVIGDDARAQRALAGMRGASEPFDRAAGAIEAMLAGDGNRCTAALEAIVADFEARERHLTGVAIADTALMLQCLAARRELDIPLRSPLVRGG